MKLERELRPCIVGGYENVKTLFHMFALKTGNAIVELEDGTCIETAPWNIKFIDSKHKEYCWD